MSCVFRLLGGCDRAQQSHHIVPKRLIKARHRTLAYEHRSGGPAPFDLPKALLDGRNLVGVCWAHHQAVENHRLYVTPELWPDGIGVFAEGLGLGWFLEREEAA